MKTKSNNTGSSLVIVLGMLAVLTLMAVAFSTFVRTERAGTTNLRHNLTAQNGIYSALSQALSDIDKDIGDDVIPQRWENYVMASDRQDVSYEILDSGDSHSDIKVSLLSERAQRHLNPTTKALVKNAKVDWRLIYAGIPVSNYSEKNDKARLIEDTTVARVAYVAVNTTGYLDPNMVGKENESSTVVLPKDTHQLNDKSFIKKTKGLNLGAEQFFKARDDGFTSFADLYNLNQEKMFINLSAPNKTSCLFLPDILGPAIALGMSPYPARMKDIDDYEGTVLEDLDPLTEAVHIDGVKTLTSDDMEKAYIAFHSVFERKNWIEENTYGEGKISFDKPVTNVEWEFPRVGQMRSTLTRADLALLSFAEYYSHKNGRSVADNEYLEMAIDIINDNSGSPIYNKAYSFDGEKYEGYLNAPCFKSVPMLTAVLGWTDRPELEPKKLYRHEGSGKFSDAADDDVLPPGTSTAKYYAKYELPVHLLLWAANPYGKDAQRNDATMNAKIKFGENLDGSELFKNINGGDDISGDPKVIVDPDKDFEKFVETPLELSGEEKNNRVIKIEKELDEVITVYIRHDGDPRTSTEENPISVSDIKKLYSWDKAGFGKDLDKYSIDVFLTVNIEAKGEIVQAVPAPRIGRGKEDDLSSYIHFKLPLFSENADKKDIHRIGYAMPIDQRFAYATECMNEFREGGLESFPYWVNNAMAEKVGEFSALKSFEKGVSDIDDFIRTSNMAPDPTNPYAKLAMGYTAEGDGDVNSAFWEGLMKHDSTGLDYGRPYPDTLHKVPGSNIYTANLDYDKSDLEVDWEDAGIKSVGELGMLCIGPWETLSLYRTETPNGEYDFHTVLDFFTVDPPTKLMSGKVNLNAPPLLMTQEKSIQRVKLAMDHNGSYSNPNQLKIGGNIKQKDYVEASNGMNPEPLMAVLCGAGFDYRTSWEVASRILAENIDWTKNDGVYFFKDVSQLGYAESYNGSLLEYLMNEDNVVAFDRKDINVYSDQGREMLISRMASHVTTRGQSFTIVLRADAFAPKLGSDYEGTTLASKVAIVEAWRDTEPARDSEGEIVCDSDGNLIRYHNWHIRSVRIVE